ncbi:MAG: hypothetical protein LUE63_01615 [Lachnospiraceae bacterium]|nr:hypothetical protein [Lachnospiraceae bacterium]
MKKSVYSLVLSDDVVRAIDQLAYENNTSRSNLINQILAERVSLATPEMQMRNIFDSMEKLMDETFQILNQSSDSMVSIRSPLRYKYKPTLRYSLELYRSAGPATGRLKISFRTQNRQLIDTLNDFFAIWIALESHYLARYFPDGIEYLREDGRLTRELYHPANLPACSGEDVGEAIASYIKMLDSCIKEYFANLALPASTLAERIENRYRTCLADPNFIVI